MPLFYKAGTYGLVVSEMDQSQPSYVGDSHQACRFHAPPTPLANPPIKRSTLFLTETACTVSPGFAKLSGEIRGRSPEAATETCRCPRRTKKKQKKSHANLALISVFADTGNGD